MKWTGIAEGDRVYTKDGRWGSITAGKRLASDDPIYKVRFDEAPTEQHWIGSCCIERLHRGAGEPLNEGGEPK